MALAQVYFSERPTLRQSGIAKVFEQLREDGHISEGLTLSLNPFMVVSRTRGCIPGSGERNHLQVVVALNEPVPPRGHHSITKPAAGRSGLQGSDDHPIASHWGWASAAHFSRCFHEAYGCSRGHSGAAGTARCRAS